MKKNQLKYVSLLVLAWLCLPMQVTDATASRMNKQDVYKMLQSGNSEAVRSLLVGEREIFLATIAMNQGDTKQALTFLKTKAVKKNRLAALIRAEAYRRQSVQAANRAGHYAHAVNDDIGTLKRVRITTGLDEANKRLKAFMKRVERAESAALKSVDHKEFVSKPVVVVRPVQLQSVRGESSEQARPKPVVIPLSRERVSEQQTVVVNVVEAKPVELKPVKSDDDRSVRQEVTKVKGGQVVSTSLSISESVREVIETWRKDWQSRDNNAYLSHYHKSFKTPKYDYNSWVKYKRRVNGKKSFIKVALSNIKVIPSSVQSQEGEAVLVTFNQRYQSNDFNAVSRKQLYMARKSQIEPWLILYEGDGR